MNKLVAVIILLLFVSQSVAETSTCVVAMQAYKDASRIRTLDPKKPVPCFLKNQQEVKKYLIDAVAHKIPSKKIKGEEQIYKALGFIPKEFDYVHGIVDLYVSQLGGYYDPEKKYYVMAAWLPDALQPTIAVHELTHALQDQYYNLEHFLDDKTMSSDLLLARSALVEGDATAVMNDYQRGLVGLGPLSKEDSVDMIIFQTVLGSYISEGLSNAPSGLKNVLLFPYASGLRFVHTILKQQGYAGINKVFINPPKSTEEILHPEKYPSKPDDFHVIGREVLEDKSIIVSHEDTLGEFFISTWLSSAGGDNNAAIEAAKGWGGDRIFVLEGPGSHNKIRWYSSWDSDNDASEFEIAARNTLERVYNGKTSMWSIEKSSRNVLISIEGEK